MTNQEAIELLEQFAETASTAVQTAVWASAFLTEGGEPTWDAIKSVALSAQLLAEQSKAIVRFTEDEIFEQIIP